jgi:cytochrome c biogenesis protein CcmG/thiol:disulfide interchange protein DsbE
MKLRTKSAVVLLALSGIASAADTPHARAALLDTKDRKPAPRVELKDASGKTAKLRDYRGKVVLLDFWATWCTGCKEEIPWFAEFQKNYGKQGFAVVGVSLDEDGWKVLKPFLAEHQVPYRMLLGDQNTAKQFGFGEMLPDTFLIDRKGRIAAAYTGSLVDRDDVEANIKAMLARK